MAIRGAYASLWDKLRVHYVSYGKGRWGRDARGEYMREVLHHWHVSTGAGEEAERMSMLGGIWYCTPGKARVEEWRGIDAVGRCVVPSFSV